MLDVQITFLMKNRIVHELHETAHPATCPSVFPRDRNVVTDNEETSIFYKYLKEG